MRTQVLEMMSAGDATNEAIVGTQRTAKVYPKWLPRHTANTGNYEGCRRACISVLYLLNPKGDLKMKVVTIEATFPELKSGAMYQQGRGQGSTVKVAFAAAGRNLFKQPKLKGRRFTMFTATISVGTITAEPKETSQEIACTEIKE